MINIFFFFFARIFESQLAISIVDKQSFYLFIYLFIIIIIIILLIEKVDKQSLCNGRITQSTNSKKE